MLARHFHRHPPGEVTRLRDLIVPALIAAGPVGLIVLQRDMGVAVLTLLISTTYLLFVRIPLRAWAVVAGMAAVAFAGPLAVRVQGVPARAHPRLPRSCARPARVRLPGDAVAHRRRFRRSSSVRAISKDRRRSCSSCRPSTRTSRSPCSPKSWASSAVRCCSACYLGDAALGARRRRQFEGRLRRDARRRRRRHVVLAGGDQRRDGARSRTRHWRAAAARFVRRFAVAREPDRASVCSRTCRCAGTCSSGKGGRRDGGADRRVLRHGQDPDRREFGVDLHAPALRAGRDLGRSISRRGSPRIFDTRPGCSTSSRGRAR